MVQQNRSWLTTGFRVKRTILSVKCRTHKHTENWNCEPGREGGNITTYKAHLFLDPSPKPAGPNQNTEPQNSSIIKKQHSSTGSKANKTLPAYSRNLNSSMAHSEPYCNRVVIVAAAIGQGAGTGHQNGSAHIPPMSSPGSKANAGGKGAAAGGLSAINTDGTKTTFVSGVSAVGGQQASPPELGKHTSSESRLCGQEPMLRISVPFRNNPLLRHN